ncbi:Athe_2463 domain-containing protein [Paenibacillus massiliensis]|uniref:Athe_2463 domain-containing protein n=1 Tax=Paenibacillus massiliensis TaxID=225917 RepID=UPI0004705DE9|nr:hypothetical protein [Paenibacillus massiliensis]
MKRKRIWTITKGLVLIGLIAGSLVYQVYQPDIIPKAFAFGGDLVTAHWDDGTGKTVRDISDPPVYVTYNASPQKDWYDSIGITRLYEEYHMNKFLWYSPTEQVPALMQNSNTDHSMIYENNLVRGGTNYAYLVRPGQTGIWQNLKLGSMDPNYQSRDHYNGDNSGTTTIVNTGTLGGYYGKNYEWRYLGVSDAGIPISNPYFPSDFPSGDQESDWNPLEKDWWNYPWMATEGHPAKTTASAWDVSPDEDPEGFEQKVQWFIKYLLPANENLRRPGKTVREDAVYYAKKLSILNNPDLSTGIALGWHGLGYYATFVMKSPPRNNLRVIEYKVTNKTTDEVVGLMTADANNNDNIKKKWEINNQEVSAGDTLLVTAKVKNMDQRPKFEGRATRYTPIRMMQMAAFDEDSLILGKWSSEVTEDVIPSEPTSKINVGQVVSFDKTKNDATGQTVQWEYKVPSTIKREFVLGAEVSPGFKLYNDNIYTGDDDGRLRFKLKEEDIGLVESSIELLDDQGNVTTEVVPGMKHGLRITVKKFQGNKLVGDPNDYYNPFAAVSIVVSDTASVYKDHEKVSTTKALTFKGDTAVIELRDAITPIVPTLKADFQIHWFNASPDYGNQSSDPSNDKASKVWRSKNNISVSNFNILPTSAIGPSSVLRENLTFDFDITNINPENQPKNIKYEIRDRNGQVVVTNTVEIQANVPFPVSVTVNNVPLQASTNGTINPFVVEVNPPPRQIIESSPDMPNPYIDNIANNSVKGYKTDQTIQPCLVVKTQNNWKETHSIHERHGYRVRTKYGSYCVTTSDKKWDETRSYYEEYKITNVMFRSKLTKDTLGGDGWVDILANPSQAKVKAGYGFEIKYIIKYDTNYYVASPKSWVGDCSFKRVKREYTASTKAPTTMYVKMPFKDSYGNNVTYTLNSPTESGSWDNLTQVFEMSEHIAFGLKKTREVFVNETARDGIYNMEIFTYPYFYGSHYKPNQSKFLCDFKTIPITVIGANSDDIKSHVTQ